MSRYGFVILHYGDLDVTRTCVSSIMELEVRSEDEIVIMLVDNDGIEHDVEKQKTFQHMVETARNANEKNSQIKLEYHFTQKDTGFSKANNEGYRYIREQYQLDYVIVANNDVEFLQLDFLQRVKFSYSRYKWALLAPDVQSGNGSEHQNPLALTNRTWLQVTFTIFVNTVMLRVFPLVYPVLEWNYRRLERLKAKRGRQSVNSRTNSSQSVQEEIVPCGACLIFSELFLEKEEMAFFPETQFYYEEYLLYERCRRNGYRIIYDADVVVEHKDGVATKKKAGDSRARLKFIMRNTVDSARIYRRVLR